ncbi:hypothetical protein AUR64_07430 [Haloprofundus marisrubri]|uniref:DUF8054 domain-containing protein n=1 Tax=Haloprofundus marisrubri TaxID=1514971 RepID=A0A0W1REF9_9EURY|nr:hypothetical protein [Haloprofundus marisrubri]KTG10989.1 hypothetical protein AUR64_07430 [Haloprofundus marisrubri]
MNTPEDYSDDRFSIPRGDLVRSRVVTDVGEALAAALARELTGYLVLEPQDALLLGGETRGVLTFEAGVPVVAYSVETDSGGTDALADLAVPGPFRVDVFESPSTALSEAHDTDELWVPPGSPAETLADAPDLAARTRDAAPDEWLQRGDDDTDAVAAFLEDDAKLDAIRQQARAEAEARAEQWGLTGQLADDT